jgi:hypothetical protein
VCKSWSHAQPYTAADAATSMNSTSLLVHVPPPCLWAIPTAALVLYTCALSSPLPACFAQEGNTSASYTYRRRLCSWSTSAWRAAVATGPASLHMLAAGHLPGHVRRRSSGQLDAPAAASVPPGAAPAPGPRSAPSVARLAQASCRVRPLTAGIGSCVGPPKRGFTCRAVRLLRHRQDKLLLRCRLSSPGWDRVCGCRKGSKCAVVCESKHPV